MRNNKNNNQRKVYPKGYSLLLKEFVNDVLKKSVVHPDPLANLPIKKGWKQKRRVQIRVRP